MSENTGSVTIVGAGPGIRELMTLAAVDALRAADVVLYDRLSPFEVIAEFAPRARAVDVGKTPGHHAVPQQRINELLIEHARAGANVVRLKGGDPYVFGRGGEEVLACRDAEVPVRVIPGISSAIAVPAAAGIPLTHRGVNRMFTVVSGHVPFTADELDHLAALRSSIVVLMGVTTLPSLGPGLVRAGMAPDMPAAIIERGFTASQRTTVGTISTLHTEAAMVGVASPAIIVIGEVVRLAHGGDGGAIADLDRAASLGSP